MAEAGLRLHRGMFVQHQHAVGREVVVAGDVCAGQVIVHRLVKLDANRGVLVVKQEKHLRSLLLAEADLDRVRHLDQRMQAADLPQPNHQVVVKRLLALRADVNGLAEAKVVQSERGFAGVEIFGVGGKHLAFLRFDDVAPQPRWMQVARLERPLEGEVVFLVGRQWIKFHHLQPE